jgi:DNA sulfur modification protein DndD
LGCFGWSAVFWKETLKSVPTFLAFSIAGRLFEGIRQPIYREKLSPEKMQELERRIFRLLKEGDPKASGERILDLSDRDAARVLNKMEVLEVSDVFLIQPLLEEKRELETQIRKLEGMSQVGIVSESERALFEQLQAEMESCSTQIGRKTEQLRLLEEEIILLEKRISDIEIEIEKLYEKHNVSRKNMILSRNATPSRMS